MACAVFAGAGALVAIPMPSAGASPVPRSNPTWTQTELPWTLPGPANVYLNDVACSGGVCAAVGYSQAVAAGQSVPVVGILSGGTWSFSHPALLAAASDESLFGVSCSSSTSCVAVGDEIETSGSVALAIVWDGSSWTASAVPTLAGNLYSELTSVSCAATECVAVGWEDAGASDVPLIDTLAAGSWTPSTVSFPAGFSDDALREVSCATAGSCTALGSGYDASSTVQNVIANLTSGVWTSAEVTPPTSGSDQLEGLSCWQSLACWAVGIAGGTDVGIVMSISGSATTVTSLANPAGEGYVQLGAVWCSSADACVATGRTGTSGGGAAIAETLSGGTWTPAIVAPVGGDNEAVLWGVDCTSTTACEAVGSGYRTGSQADHAFAATLDASGWTATEPTVGGPPTASIHGLSCPTSAACVGVGTYIGYTGATRSFAETRATNGWKSAFPPGPAHARAAGVFSVSCAVATRCVAAGSYRTSTGALRPFVDQLVGHTWTATTVPFPKQTSSWLSGVSCPSTTTCVAVGTWSQSPDPSTYCAAPCGSGVFVDQLVGTKWTETGLPTPKGEVNPEFNDVSCWSTSRCIAVGSFFRSGNFYGFIETKNASIWRASSAGAPSGGAWADLASVDCTTASACVAVGSFQETSQLPLVETGGANGPWTASGPAGTSTSMWGGYNSVSCTSSTSCVAVGTDGTHALVASGHLSTTAPTALTLPTGMDGVTLNAVSCPHVGVCVSGGQSFSSSADPPIVAVS
jgi:hypothetical protein